MTEPNYAIKWAANLVRELRKTGTGERQLGVIGRAMADKMAAEEMKHLPPTHAGRHLTSAEAIAALQRAFDGDPEKGIAPDPGVQVTLAKAKALAIHGVYIPPPSSPTARAVEDEFPPPEVETLPDAGPVGDGKNQAYRTLTAEDVAARCRTSDPWPVAPVKPADPNGKPDAEKSDVRLPTAGISTPKDDVPTVGPKPVRERPDPRPDANPRLTTGG